jgi:tRNA(adenine34) deaminase
MSLETQQSLDESFMREALAQADFAEEKGEVPVGAVVVIDNEIVATGYNLSICNHDPTAHAELIAVRDAAARIENYRLIDATVYVTLEPCPMCAGMLVHARVKRLVYGAADYKTGACGSVYDIACSDKLNHVIDITPNVLADECADKISSFFKKRREQKKQAKKSA